MRKVIAAINVTLDGFCDHTAMIADDELHEHYNELLRNAGVLLYGRKTYQLMESFWPGIVKKPSGNKPIDDFAVLIDDIPKIVFSRTLKGSDIVWKNTSLASSDLPGTVSELKQQEGKPIFAGSPSLIVALSNLGMVDEYQLCVQPILLGQGLSLFKNINERIDLKLINTKHFNSGSMVLYYERRKNSENNEGRIRID